MVSRRLWSTKQEWWICSLQVSKHMIGLVCILNAVWFPNNCNSVSIWCVQHTIVSLYTPVCCPSVYERLKQLNLALLFWQLLYLTCSGCHLLTEDASTFCSFPMFLSTLDAVNAVIRPIILCINNIFIPVKQKWVLSWNHKCLHFLGSPPTIKSSLGLANYGIVIQPQVINKCICSLGGRGRSTT